MNILFATLVDIQSINERGIYQDLMREIAGMGHKVYIVSPSERWQNKPTTYIETDSGGILKVRIGNIQKTNRIEKGISTLLLESQYVRAVRKYLRDIKFDVIVYSTPPITLVKLVKKIKKRDGAVNYLLLKDIFPQNAVDLGLLSGNGIMQSFFRRKERELYRVSDHIGCMSPANAEYLLTHNEYLAPEKVHVCPNSVTPMSPISSGGRDVIRERYGIPAGAKVFVYGGNLGRPQCVTFIVDCLKQNQNKDDRFFLVCGGGTDSEALSEYIRDFCPNNVKQNELLPKDEYDEILSVCDVGLIFLDHRFTIPNFPSRLLSYMEQGLPVLACTDVSTDIGRVIETGGFGWWCESNDPLPFTRLVDEICRQGADELSEIGMRGRRYLEENYLASESAKIIMNRVSREHSH